MTATNHAMTGAVIAVSIPEPWLAIPLAFASHFLLDAIPHFGIYEDDVLRRNKHWLFRSVITIDILLVLTLLITVPIYLNGQINPWIVLSCMIAAVLPDLIWVYRFFGEVKTQTWKPGGKFARFHQGIQKIEQPWGLIIELIWFVGALLLVRGVIAL